MNHQIQQEVSDLGIEAYLSQHERKSLLRFLTCGSVDDGKSTLIGRLLHDSHQIYEDQLAAVNKDSAKVGTTGEKPDLALLVDGLQAEREQGITIDVAYRYFSTQKRKFIIADTPGHEQYTRNMATGASTCDVAIILIDARKGVLDQTRRHSYIASLLGIRHFIVAINKMDLVDFDQATFESIRDEYLAFAEKLKQDIDIKVLPLSALDGDNVVGLSDQTPWYEGESLLSLLENVDLNIQKDSTGWRFPVQYVNRPNLDFRGFSGTVSEGVIAVGDPVKALPSGKTSRIASIVTFDGNLPQAQKGQAVTLTLDDEIDVSRGDLLVPIDHQASAQRQWLADVVWMHDDSLQLGREYDIKIAGKLTQGQVMAVEHQININQLTEFASNTLPLNGIGLCRVAFNEALPLESYSQCTDTGGFIIIDRLTNVTVGAGMIRSAVISEDKPPQFGEFELAFNALIRQHFPHWDAKDISLLGK
jgi:sulfate adenylyltransferase subunit 1